MQNRSSDVWAAARGQETSMTSFQTQVLRCGALILEVYHKDNLSSHSSSEMIFF